MIILMGVAGAGKSVQGKLLADEAGYPWLSTGELLRVLITGQRRHEMVSGKLLGDEEVIGVVNTALNLIDTSREFVLDGFPRTITQADWVLDQVDKKRFELTAVFHLMASDQVVRERLSHRGRQDDSDAAVNKRFQEYKTSTLPILKYFEKNKIPIYSIDGSKKPVEVHQLIMSKLDAIKSSKK